MKNKYSHYSIIAKSKFLSLCNNRIFPIIEYRPRHYSIIAKSKFLSLCNNRIFPIIEYRPRH